MFQLQRTANCNSTVLTSRRARCPEASTAEGLRAQDVRAQPATLSSILKLLTTSPHGCKMAVGVQVSQPEVGKGSSPLACVSRDEGTSFHFRSQLARICHVSMPQPVTSKEMGPPWLAEMPGARSAFPEHVAIQRRSNWIPLGLRKEGAGMALGRHQDHSVTC